MFAAVTTLEGLPMYLRAAGLTGVRTAPETGGDQRLWAVAETRETGQSSGKYDSHF